VSNSACVLDESYFKTFGFIVLRQFFEARPLAEEIDQVLNHGLPASSEVSQYGEIRFQYVPMMSATTPVSVALLDRAAVLASTLLGSAVIPTRAKAVRYFGNTPWHVDSVLPLESIGFAAYLEPVGLENGALRVIPGSHQRELGSALREFGAIGMTATTLPSFAVATEPGDMAANQETFARSKRRLN
jgi:Phytanoyl-CoA dioxygenase (PhyH)